MCPLRTIHLPLGGQLVKKFSTRPFIVEVKLWRLSPLTGCSRIRAPKAIRIFQAERLRGFERILLMTVVKSLPTDGLDAFGTCFSSLFFSIGCGILSSGSRPFALSAAPSWWWAAMMVLQWTLVPLHGWRAAMMVLQWNLVPLLCLDYMCCDFPVGVCEILCMAFCVARGGWPFHPHYAAAWWSHKRYKCPLLSVKSQVKLDYKRENSAKTWVMSKIVLKSLQCDFIWAMQ